MLHMSAIRSHSNGRRVPTCMLQPEQCIPAHYLVQLQVFRISSAAGHPHAPWTHTLHTILFCFLFSAMIFSMVQSRNAALEKFPPRIGSLNRPDTTTVDDGYCRVTWHILTSEWICGCDIQPSEGIRRLNQVRSEVYRFTTMEVNCGRVLWTKATTQATSSFARVTAVCARCVAETTRQKLSTSRCHLRCVGPTTS